MDAIVNQKTPVKEENVELLHVALVGSWAESRVGAATKKAQLTAPVSSLHLHELH